METDKDVEADGSPEPTEERSSKHHTYFTLFLGLLLTVVFIASFIVQFNDTSGITTWIVIYFFSGALALIGLFKYYIFTQCFTPSRALSLCVFLGMYALVLAIVSSVKVARAEPGGDKEGGDGDNLTDRTEKAYELGGAILCLLSAVYHYMMFQGYGPCC